MEARKTANGSRRPNAALHRAQTRRWSWLKKSAWSVTTTRKSIISCSVLVLRLGYSTAAARSLSSLTGLPIFAASNAITSKVPVGLPSRDK